jgi:hypothetical protein
VSTEAEAKILAELAELRALVAKGITPRPVLSVAEAAELASCGSASAFHRWCAAWRVKACGQGRYARRAVVAGLERETNSGRRRRRTSAPSTS